MAKYFGNSYRGRQRKTYSIWGAVVVVSILILIYSPICRNKKPQQQPLPVNQTSEPQSKPQSEPVVEIVKVEVPVVAEVKEDAQINIQAKQQIDEAMALLQTSPAKIIEARDILNDVLHNMNLPIEQSQMVKAKLSQLSDQWLFSRRNFPQDPLCDIYKVQSGDVLERIGRQFKVPYASIMQINNITDDKSLRAGEKIKVINGPFHARIDRSTFTMDLYLQNTFVRSFAVGIGKQGRETPTGRWLVEPGGKLRKPTWTDPDTGITYEAEDPNYPLGSIWIKLKGLEGDAVGRTGIAFHGTNENLSVGRYSSRGCIRLRDDDAELVYNLLQEGHSQVIVAD